MTVMGKGCKEVVRVHTADTDIVVGHLAGWSYRHFPRNPNRHT
jgi:hypothetical protein